MKEGNQQQTSLGFDRTLVMLQPEPRKCQLFSLTPG